MNEAADERYARLEARLARIEHALGISSEPVAPVQAPALSQPPPSRAAPRSGFGLNELLSLIHI